MAKVGRPSTIHHLPVANDGRHDAHLRYLLRSMIAGSRLCRRDLHDDVSEPRHEQALYGCCFWRVLRSLPKATFHVHAQYVCAPHRTRRKYPVAICEGGISGITLRRCPLPADEWSCCPRRRDPATISRRGCCQASSNESRSVRKATCHILAQYALERSVARQPIHPRVRPTAVCDATPLCGT